MCNPLESLIECIHGVNDERSLFMFSHKWWAIVAKLIQQDNIKYIYLINEDGCLNLYNNFLNINLYINDRKEKLFSDFNNFMLSREVNLFLLFNISFTWLKKIFSFCVVIFCCNISQLIWKGKVKSYMLRKQSSMLHNLKVFLRLFCLLKTCTMHAANSFGWKFTLVYVLLWNKII